MSIDNSPMPNHRNVSKAYSASTDSTVTMEAASAVSYHHHQQQQQQNETDLSSSTVPNSRKVYWIIIEKTKFLFSIERRN
jgi:hypothetical protein